MTLTNRLQEFRFNLETMELLQNMGQSSQEISNELSFLRFSPLLITFCQSSRHLLNSVLLRLNIYSRQNMNEQQIRQSLTVLNNDGVLSLVDYLFDSQTSSLIVQTQQPETQQLETQQPETQQPETQQPETQQPETQQLEEQSEESEDDENDSLDTFFTKCIIQTDDSSDILKTGDAYASFQEWWEGQYDEEVPDKKELKEFLNGKLGKCVKSKWTNVMLA
jgi:hypothetical protein